MSKILLIDDEADVRYSFQRTFADSDIEIETASSGEEGLELIPRVQPDLVIMDVRMGGMDGLETLRRIRQANAKLPVIMITAYGTTQIAIEAMKLGAYDYLLKPFDIPRLKELIHSALRVAREMKQVVSFQPMLESEDYEMGIVGRSEAMQQVFKLVGQLADSDATALITGESGTGKELVARAIHRHGKRAEQPFIAINCAAIPENLLESELFGHEKGAFTGATQQRIGKFEQCDKGTIFLDEIGDMPPHTQIKILRVLQSGTFERVGGNQTIHSNVRIIAATNKPLEQAVADKTFREDLFYRLNVVRIQIPPLRERKEDIPLLINYFLKSIAQNQKTSPKSIQPEAVTRLKDYRWPGNVRELENVIRRAVVVAKSDAILSGDLPSEINPSAPVSPSEESSQAAPGFPAGGEAPTIPELAGQLFKWAREHSDLQVLPAVERELIICALSETGGNQVRAAKLLGITRATLRKRVEKFAIKQEMLIR